MRQRERFGCRLHGSSGSGAKWIGGDQRSHNERESRDQAENDADAASAGAMRGTTPFSSRIGAPSTFAFVGARDPDACPTDHRT